MSEAKVRKALAQLESFEKSSGLSRRGKDWLVTASDPFHDLPLSYEGFPDVSVSGSIVQLVKQTLTIKKPASITGLWDCNIFNLPWFQAYQSGGYVLDYNRIVSGSVTQTGIHGGICALAVPTGDPTLFPQSGTGATYSLPVPAAYFSGPARVVAAGFEVHNTTSDLYRQGSVTSYRQPHPNGGEFTAILAATSAGTVLNAFTLDPRSFQPTTVAEASLLLGSRTWEAEKGCYSVCTLNTENLPTIRRTSRFPCMINSAQTNCVVGGFAGVTATPNLSERVNYNHFNLSGAYFTGLSEETTLTINFNVYIERFPTADNSDLVVLAKPSPAYDPIAIELYTRMLETMPVGVPVAENGLGDWFAGAVSELAPLFEQGLSMIPHPYAQVAAQGARYAGKIAKNFVQTSPSGGEPRLGLNEERMERKRVKRERKAAAKAKARLGA